MTIVKSTFALRNSYGYVVTKTEKLQLFRDIIALRLSPELRAELAQSA